MGRFFEGAIKGFIFMGTLGTFWAIGMIENNPKAGFAIAMSCLAGMLALIWAGSNFNEEE